MINEKEKFMKVALHQAKLAYKAGEVPVGALIVRDGEIIARGYNSRKTKSDPTGHAEIIVLRKAGKKLGTWNLEGCDLYVTKEPCVMCSGAIVQSRIRNVYYGAFDKRFGCCGTVYNLAQDKVFNHRAVTEGGVLEEDCAKILTQFFKERRNEK